MPYLATIRHTSRALALSGIAQEATLCLQEHLSLPVTMIIVGRDVLLVSASLLHRLRAFGWRWPGWAEFLRVQDSSKGATADEVPQEGQQEASSPQPNCDAAAAAPQPASAGPAAAHRPPAAAIVKPLYISKVNTCLQVVSGAAYVRSYFKGNFQ